MGAMVGLVAGGHLPAFPDKWALSLLLVGLSAFYFTVFYLANTLPWMMKERDRLAKRIAARESGAPKLYSKAMLFNGGLLIGAAIILSFIPSALTSLIVLLLALGTFCLMVTYYANTERGRANALRELREQLARLERDIREAEWERLW